MPRRPIKDSTSYREIGERLRTLRMAKDWSQARFAKILGTHQTNVSELERGVRGMTVRQLMRLTKALQVSPNDILQGAATKRNGKTPSHAQLPGRFVRRLHRIVELPKSEQQALLKIMDRMIEANRK